MDENFSFRVNLINGLISAKSVFDKKIIGEINGRSIFVNAFWFDRKLNVKYIEIATLETDGAPESAFIDSSVAYLSEGSLLNLPRAGNFLKINSDAYKELSNEYEKDFAWISCWGFGNGTKARVSNDELKVKDFLINTQEWKITEIVCGNWLSTQRIHPSALLNFGKNYFQFAA